jgi:hypothetical protein
MNLPIKIISTDFDGTFFAEFENPPVRCRGGHERGGAGDRQVGVALYGLTMEEIKLVEDTFK